VLARLVLIWAWPWAGRQRELHLFNSERGPAALAQACLSEDEPARVLAELGLEDLHGQGLVLMAQLVAVANVEKALASGREPDARLERLLRWAVDAGGVAPKLRGPPADALLRPWLSRSVPDQLKQRIQEFLLQHYGDPRTKPQRWMEASDEACQVFRKWLAGVALAQFLEVIDRLALDRQWRYRRAFWTAYFDRDWVWDAQVAFGPSCAILARQLFGREVPFATLVKGGRKLPDRNHAVLLLRIGDLVIADWSHNGRCVIWRVRNPHAPSLQKPRYTSDDVDWSSADRSWVHAGAASYAWQNKVRGFIAEETGLVLHQREFSMG
jgi:EH_Signature domain